MLANKKTATPNDPIRLQLTRLAEAARVQQQQRQVGDCSAGGGGGGVSLSTVLGEELSECPLFQEFIGT